MQKFIKTAAQELEFTALTKPDSDTPTGEYRMIVWERDAEIVKLRRVKGSITLANLQAADFVAMSFETAPDGTEIDFTADMTSFYVGTEIMVDEKPNIFKRRKAA